jgi:predicted O-methyltransferase YrrM
MHISPQTQSVLDRMAAYESTFDSQFAISKETGEFLHALVTMAKPSRILEFGTWRGASSIYMADALKQLGSGHVTSVEKSVKNVLAARANIDEAGLTPYVTVVHEDVDDFLRHDRGAYELVFIDAMKSKTTAWLTLVLEKHTHAHSRIIIDDVKKSRDKMSGLFEFLDKQGMAFEEYNLGNGILLVKPYVK